jgi:hypothetical protein
LTDPRDSHLARIARRLEAAWAGPRSAGALLFATSFAAYFCIGHVFASSGAHAYYNIFFNADCPRVIRDIAQWGHSRTNAHPIFALLVTPVGGVVGLALGHELTAALVVNAGAGALGVVVMLRILTKMQVPRPEAAIVSAMYGATTSSFVLGCIPETFSLCSLSLLLAVAANVNDGDVERSGGFARNLVAGVFSMGITTTNVVHSAVVYWSFSLRRWRLARATLLAVSLGFAVTACVAALSVAQKAIFIGSAPFFQRAYEQERQYMYWPVTLPGLLDRWKLLLLHMGGFNVVAPRFHHFLNGAPFEWITFMAEPGKRELVTYSLRSGTVALLWFVVLSTATWTILSRGAKRSHPVARVVGLWMACVFALFSVYGDDFLLYSPMWTPHVFLWIGLAIAGGGPVAAPLRPRFLSLVLAGMILSNVRFLDEVARIHTPGAGLWPVFTAQQRW